MTTRLTFDDIQVDLGVIPSTLTESFDKKALDFLLSDKGKTAIQDVMDSYGELVHSAGNNDQVDLAKKLEDQLQILKNYRRKGGGGARKVVAFYRKKWGGKERGRRFAPGSCSLQSISRPIRHTIACSIYYDADMKNCHPVALEYFCTQHNIPCSLLHEYNTHRDKWFAELTKASADTAMEMGKGKCKTLMLKIVNGGKIHHELKAWGEKAPSWVEGLWHRQIIQCSCM